MLVVAVPGLTALCLGLWGAGALSFDRDEAVTVSMVRRPVSGIWQVLPHADAVHGLYYLMLHFVAAAYGTSEFVLRLPAVIGTAIAAMGVAAIGHKLAGPLTGLLAGAMYGATPVAGYYAHDARQYTIVTATATLVTLLYLRALERQSPRAYVAYAAGLAVLGLLHLFAVLLIAAHLLALLCGRPTRARLAATVAAAASALVALTPLITAAWTQQNLISWATRPGIGTIGAFFVDFTGGRLAWPVLTALMITAWLPWPRRNKTDESGGPAVGLRTLAAAWFLLPPALLITVSQLHPVFSPRYALVSLPGAALLAAAGAVRLPWRSAGAGAFAVAIALTIPPNIQERRPSFAYDQFREAAQIVDAGKRPGDAVLFLPDGRRSVADAYPRAFTGVDDIALGVPAAQAAALTATEVSAATLRRRFEAAAPERTWLVAFSRYAVCRETYGLTPMNYAKVMMLDQWFWRQDCRQVHGLTVELYVRRAGTAERWRHARARQRAQTRRQ
jgi:mannosyltransferase